MARAHFDWQDPFAFSNMLTEEERMIRDTAVQTFLNETEAALARVTGPGAEVAAAAVRRWAKPGTVGQGGARLPVCDWIAPALAAQSSPLAASFAAFSATRANN